MTRCNCPEESCIVPGQSVALSPFLYDVMVLCCMQSVSLATSSAHPRRHQPRPVADVSMIPTEVAARLASVPVYTVADKNNQFVLVTGEVRTDYIYKRSDQLFGNLCLLGKLVIPSDAC